MNNVCPAETFVFTVEVPDTEGAVATIVYWPGETFFVITEPFDKSPTEDPFIVSGNLSALPKALGGR
jgi:hypothetical protein